MWKMLEDGIEEDERVIFPDMYIKNRRLYDKIVDVVYLVKNLNDPEIGLDLVFTKDLDRLTKIGGYSIIAKQLIVRLRMPLPWFPDETEEQFMISQEELNEHREELQVLDIYLRVAEIDNPDAPVLVSPLEFEMNREKYEVLEARYLACWKLTPEAEKRLLDIEPDNWHSYMEK